MHKTILVSAKGYKLSILALPWWGVGIIVGIRWESKVKNLYYSITVKYKVLRGGSLVMAIMCHRPVKVRHLSTFYLDSIPNICLRS